MSLSSLPVTTRPRDAMIRAMAERAAPPMPTKCTRPSSSAGSSTSGTGTFIGRPACEPTSRTMRASRSSASRGTSPDAAAPIAASRIGSVARDGTWPATHAEVSSSSFTSSAPPASTTGRALRTCSPLPIGNGTKMPGSPTAAASMTLLAPPRESTRSAAAYARSIRSTNDTTAYGTSPGSGVASPCGPTTCSTCTPAPASAADAPETAWLSRRAPCEPPVTSRVGRSGSRSKKRRASARIASRSSRAIIVRSGSPTYSAFGSGVSGKLTATRRAMRAPALLARPGTAFCSCRTIGTLRRRAARYAGIDT